MTVTAPTATDAHQELILKLEDEPIVRLRRIAPPKTSSLKKVDLVRRIAEERTQEARVLVGLDDVQPTQLTHDQKRRLGQHVLVALADLTDRLDEEDDLRDLPPDLAKAQIVNWCYWLPTPFEVDDDGKKTGERWWPHDRLTFAAPPSWTAPREK